MSFENKQGITRIRMTARCRCFCPMGDDWYSADVEMEMRDPVEIPDYCEVDRFIRGEVDGKALILEDVCEKVFDHLKPVAGRTVVVSVTSHDAVHSPVTVEKEG